MGGGGGVGIVILLYAAGNMMCISLCGEAQYIL